MNPMAVTSLVLVAVGVLLIILGAWMSLNDWKAKREGVIGAKKEGLDKSLTALTKLLEAMKDYPPGQRLIVFGIVVLIIAGLFGGIGGL